MTIDMKRMSNPEGKDINVNKKGISLPFVAKLLMVDFLMLVLTYGGFYRSIFANSDTLWGALDPSSTFKARLDCCRWIPAIIEWTMNNIGFLPALNFRLSLFLFICTLSVSLLMLQVVFVKLFDEICNSYHNRKELRIFVILAVSVSFVNVLFTEFFYFTESFYIFGLAFLFMGIGIYMLSRKRIGLSILFFLCMTMCYQMSCPIATICIGVYVYLEHRGELSFELIKDELIKALPPMILFVLDFVTGPVVQGILAKFGIESYMEKSPSGDYSLSEYLSIILLSIKELVSSNLGLTPGGYICVLGFGISAIVVLFASIKRKSWNQVASFLCVEIILTVLVLAVPIAENPRYFVARTVLPLFFALSMQFLIMIFYISYYHDYDTTLRYIKKTLYILPALFMLFNIFFIQCIIENRIVSETLDSLYAERIFDTIEAYEEETGIIVDKIAPTNDTDSSPFYDQVHFCRGAVNRRCYSYYTWTFLQYCAYETNLAGKLSGRSFERVSMDESIYKEYFEGKNWDYFDAEKQIVIRGDTVYICVF